MPPRLRRILRVLACLILDLPWQLHALDDIYIKPVNHTGPMIEGEQYELQCDIVNVASVQSLTVKWYKREKEEHNETFNDIIKTPVNKTSTIKINVNRSDNGTQYRCEAEMNVEPAAQNVSTLKSKSLTIEVHYKPVINETKLPSLVPVFRGYHVVLFCEAKGNPPPEISWTINNVLVKGGTLNITEAASQNIVCIANNSVGTVRREVRVGVTDIYIKPVNHTGPMIEGSKYELQCDIVNVASVESLTVKWYNGGTPVHDKTFNDIIKTPVNVTSTFEITANRSDNGAQYRCEAEMNVEPAAQNVSPLSSESLTIKIYYKPVINKTKLPSKVPVFQGIPVFPVVLSCEAEGNPTPEINWKTNPNNLVNGGTLTITEATSQNPVCIAKNSVGNDSREVEVVLKALVKPVINKTKLPSDVPVFRGYPVVLSCEAEGNPTPEISWKTNPNNLVNGGNLTITEATSQNPVCIAKNSVGNDSRIVKVVLTEDYLPLIAGLVAITVAVISVIFIFIYSIYYKTAKMGHYSLKDTKHCAQNGNIAQNGKDNTIPMKKLSQSDILA